MMEKEKKDSTISVSKRAVVIGGVLLVVIIMGIGLTIYFTNFFCNHKYKSSVLVEATCASEGKMLYRCTKCDKEYTKKTPKNGEHFHEGEITKKATCKNKGIATYTCKYCGDSYTEEISGDHDWMPATCISPAKCSVCGATTGEKETTHTFDSNGICSVCKTSKYTTKTVNGVTFKMPKTPFTSQDFRFDEMTIKVEDNIFNNVSSWLIEFSGENVGYGEIEDLECRVSDSEGYIFGDGGLCVTNIPNGRRAKDRIMLYVPANTDFVAGRTYYIDFE